MSMVLWHIWSTNQKNQKIKFDPFDFLIILSLKKIPHTDRPTDIWPYRSDLPSLKNRTWLRNELTLHNNIISWSRNTWTIEHQSPDPITEQQPKKMMELKPPQSISKQKRQCYKDFLLTQGVPKLRKHFLFANFSAPKALRN